LKIVGILFALVLAVSLLIPATASAEDCYAGLANCAWDRVKWQDNPNSWHLYLQNWGRTPIQSMSRLGGLCAPSSLCAAVGTNCPSEDCGATAGCPACRIAEQGAMATCDDLIACEASACEACSCEATAQVDCATCDTEPVLEGELPTCCCCWGRSLAFANKGWSGSTIGTHPRINDNHLNHFGTSECYGGNKGGDWGISGCPHTECCDLTWCLQDNCFASRNCAPR